MSQYNRIFTILREGLKTGASPTQTGKFVGGALSRIQQTGDQALIAKKEAQAKRIQAKVSDRQGALGGQAAAKQGAGIKQSNQVADRFKDKSSDRFAQNLKVGKGQALQHDIDQSKKTGFLPNIAQGQGGRRDIAQVKQVPGRSAAFAAIKARRAQRMRGDIVGGIKNQAFPGEQDGRAIKARDMEGSITRGKERRLHRTQLSRTGSAGQSSFLQRLVAKRRGAA